MERLSERTGYVAGGVNVGVIWLDERRVLMVDTGLSESNGKRVLKEIQRAGGEVVGILTTHAHADHFGANAAIVRRTGARVYAPPIDEAILRHPELMPRMLYAGADPPASMRGRFLLAESSPVDQVLPPGITFIEGREINVVSLPGHSPGQVGYRVDGVFFCADIVLPEDAIDKFKIPYICSISEHLASLDTVAAVEYDVAMPGHGDVTASLTELILLNRDLVTRLLDAILKSLSEPRTMDDLMVDMLEAFEADPHEAAVYYLIQPTIYAALSHLEQSGQVVNIIRDRRSAWVASC
ncbi:MAG TPA: MBL fold metallo-hydrolase [Thermomicrobiales bacterium]|nr:MBL fold metallo-hydrolase [Thermomicrobiales bacterium]